MTVLLLGASGLLGSNVALSLHERGWSTVGTFHTSRPDLPVRCKKCDLTERGEFRTLVEDYEPDFVINCAALTDVDGCERHPERAQSINSQVPDRIARVCEESETDLVHFSTDYVFDGQKTEKYGEQDNPNPIQVYGQTKLQGESAIRGRISDALIIRLSFVHGIHRSSEKWIGFPAWVYSELQSGNAPTLVEDQHVTPTRAIQAADTTLDLMKRDQNGVFHVANRDCVTPYEIGQIVMTEMTAGGKIIKVSREALDTVAARPANSCLDVRKLEQTLGRKQPVLREQTGDLQDYI
ncbi:MULTISPECIES: dTDP-4-dehydrorhamnose reductase [Haloarcula]|uniref:dTDP-4-dehydrorhamnose reductase n=1 Tax=Haloarcula TaxID=2237 RepID=UPI0023ED568E|nr:dTDP-4-dehydrorhamnose reductase [Halomicroarcula sp. XH51]